MKEEDLMWAEKARLRMEKMINRLLLKGVQRPTPPVGLIQPAAHGENTGRSERSALEYEDPLQCQDVIEDVFDAEFVFYMQEAPEDPLDLELLAEEHAQHCPRCRAALPLCAHCLEPRVCKRTFVPSPSQEYDEDGYILSIQLPRVRSLNLCRQCRKTAHNATLTVT